VEKFAFKPEHVAQRVRGAEWTNKIKQLFTSNPCATASLREIVDFFTASCHRIPPTEGAVKKSKVLVDEHASARITPRSRPVRIRVDPWLWILSQHERYGCYNSAAVMTPHGLVAPTHRAIRKYYEQVAALRDQRVLNEMSVRSAFEFLLADTAKLKGWTFIAELSGKSGGAIIRPDGTLRDRNSLSRALIVPMLSGEGYNGCKNCPGRGCCEIWTRDTFRFLNGRVHRRCREAELGRELKHEIA